jgi:hypothetical protein
VQFDNFGFDKFPNVEMSLGPEAAFAFRFGARRMKSTGEAIYFIKDLKEEPAPLLMRGSSGRCMGSGRCI